MSVREYIGARYVPLFMGDWDITATYEPLSIVEYQGDSYTSRQAVPANIDISNEAYWVQTGNYNAQVEAYRQEVQTFDGRIDALEAITYPLSIANGGTGQSTKAGAKQALDLGNANNNLQIGNQSNAGQTFGFYITGDNSNNATTYEKRLALITNNHGMSLYNTTDSTELWSIDERKRRRVILIGDSYLCTRTTQQGWGDFFLDYTGYQQVKRYKSGGAGWVKLGVNDTETGLNFLGMLQKGVSELSLRERELVDAIIINGGLNDLLGGYDTTSITTAVQQTVQYARTNYPNATIYISLAACSIQYDTANDMRYLNRWIGQWVMDGAVYAYNSNAWFVGKEATYDQGDGFHCNDNGYDYLARRLARLAEGNDFQCISQAFNSSQIATMMKAQIATFDDWAEVQSTSHIVINNNMYHVCLHIKITDASAIPAGNNPVYLPICTYQQYGGLAPAYASHSGKWLVRPNSAIVTANPTMTTLGLGNAYVLLTPNFTMETATFSFSNNDNVYFTFDVPLD